MLQSLKREPGLSAIGCIGVVATIILRFNPSSGNPAFLTVKGRIYARYVQALQSLKREHGLSATRSAAP